MNNTLQTLLRLLANGETCSGELLGKSLGMSRAAVWKQLQGLQDYGLVLETVRGVGYRLAQPLQLLDQAYLQAHTQFSDIHILLVSSTTSTNQFLYEAFNTANARVPTAMFAEYQTQGRGRRGRAWHSPFGCNLYFSLAWPYTQGVSRLEGVSLAIGVGICRALKNLGLEDAQLKWPNDVLCEGKKLAGILVEVGGDVSGDCFIVVGVGLNVNMPEQSDIDQPWIDLQTLNNGQAWDRNRVAVNLLNELLPILSTYTERGFASYQHAWEGLNAYQHQAVKVLIGKREVHGRCLGVTQAGALRLQVEGEECEFSGGELSLRPV